jgi:hypothetical protein
LGGDIFPPNSRDFGIVPYTEWPDFARLQRSPSFRGTDLQPLFGGFSMLAQVVVTKEKQTVKETLRQKTAGLTSKVKAAVKEVDVTAQADCGDQIMTMWQLGRRVISLDNHEAREDALGKKVQLQAIAAELLGISSSTLEKALQLYRTFPKESEIKALVAKRSRSGLALGWEHAQVLLLFRPDLTGSNRRKFDSWKGTAGPGRDCLRTNVMNISRVWKIPPRLRPDEKHPVI